MDPSTLDFITQLAPSGVYLVGLIFALRHISTLYQSRQDLTLELHAREIQALNAGHEARFKLLEESAEECKKDREVLRHEIDRLRQRLDESRPE